MKNLIYDVIDQNKKNCINCLSFKTLIKFTDYARCTNIKCANYNGVVKVVSAASMVLKKDKSKKAYSRINCIHFV